MVFLKTKLSKLTISLIALALFFISIALHSSKAAGPAMTIPDNCGINAVKVGNVSLSGNSTCSITGITGFSGGTLSITGASTIVNIADGAKLVLDPGQEIRLVPPKGQIRMLTGGGLNEGIIHGTMCILDSDNDGYANNGAPYVVIDPVSNVKQSCPANYREKATLASVTEYDCDDNNPLIHDCCTSGYRDYDKDGSGKKDDVSACYEPSASYNIVSNNYDCDDNNASIYHGWSVTSFCGVGTCGGSGSDSCSFGVRSDSCTTSAKACCNVNGTYKAAQTPISTCLKCNGTQADPINQTSSEDLGNLCSTGALGSGTSCRGANCSGTGDSCSSLANGTVCNYGAYGAWTGANGACYAYRFRPYYTCSSGTCSGTSAGSDYDANQNASVSGNVWNGSSWVAANCSSYCGIQTAYCSGQTLARGVYGCNMSGTCDNVTVRASCPPGGCTGGENNRCSGSSCVNNCSNGLDDDGDGFTDGQDTDCGGYGQCSSGACCNTTTGQFLTNATICSTGTFNNPASGSCQRVATDQYCSGSSATCSGSTVNRYQNAPANNNIWNGSSWVASTGTIYCGLSSPNTCSGQTVQRDAYGCNTSGSCGTTPNGYKVNSGVICSGGEHDYCSGGSCLNLCSDGLNNDGDTYTDALDSDCGAQCTAGDCCDVATNRYRPSSYTCRASAGTCDLAENCTGGSNVCPVDSKYSNGTLCRSSAGVCDLTDYCNGTSNLCTDSKSTALYRSATDLCDADDYCSGSSNNAPADAVKSNGTLCRNSNGSGCDYADYCNGSAKTCADSQVANGTICAYGSFGDYSGSAGSCSASASRPYYTCSSGSCSGSIAGYDYTYSYGSSGQVWNGSSWEAASGSNKCGTGSFSCSGTTSIQLQYYACNGGGSCSTYMGTYQYGACSGAENSMCVSGYDYCRNMCVNPYSDNNGDGWNDYQDPICGLGGCKQCTSGSCCNATYGCYLSSSNVCSYGSYSCIDSCTLRATDTSCSGSSSSCNGSTSYRYNYGSSGQVCSGSSFVSGSSSYYCGRTSTPTACSSNQPLDNAKYCNGGGSCTVTGTTLAYGAACSGGTPYCTSGYCYNCSSDSHCAADGFVAGTYSCSGSNVIATWRNYYCSYGCQYSDTPSTVVQNCSTTGQICSSGTCTYPPCSAQTVSGYSVPALSHGGSTTVTKGVGYRVGGGYYQATASCSSGTVTVSSQTGPHCYSGYLYTYGSWYQSTYGYYDVCVISTCSAGSVSGYSYSAMSHSQTVAASKSITNGSWNATLKCADGGVTVQSEALVCNSGHISTGSACVQCTSDSHCSSGYYCDTSATDYYDWCAGNSANNTCKKKCWTIAETKVAYVSEGDAAKAETLYKTWSSGELWYLYHSYSLTPLADNATVSYCSQANTGYFDSETTPLRNCTVVQLDNPLCMSKWASDVSFTTSNCPIGINSYVTQVSNGYGSCKQVATTLGGWRSRLRFKCSATVYPVRSFGDACRTYGSTYLNAVVDANGFCAVPQYCGDWSCNNGEDCESCPGDCGYCEVCGDGQCTGYEDEVTCYEDCAGSGESCDYNYYCDEWSGESCRSCSNDCGGCSQCDWDYECDAYEDYWSCSSDCPYPN